MKKNVFDHTLLTVPDLLCQWQTSHRSQVAGIRVEEYTKSSQITHKPLCSTSWIFRAFILWASGLACKEAAKLKLPAHVSGLQNPSSPGNGCQREEAAWIISCILAERNHRGCCQQGCGGWWIQPNPHSAGWCSESESWWPPHGLAGSINRGCGHSTCSASGSLAAFLTGSRHPFFSFGSWGTYSQTRDKCCFTVC